MMVIIKILKKEQHLIQYIFALQSFSIALNRIPKQEETTVSMSVTCRNCEKQYPHVRPISPPYKNIRTRYLQFKKRTR